MGEGSLRRALTGGCDVWGGTEKQGHSWLWRWELIHLWVPPVPSTGSGLEQTPIKSSEVACWGLEKREGGDASQSLAG